MKCPICDADLSPLDLVSRTEHVDLCIERGPCVLEVGAQGELVVKQNIPKAKVRKICPVCDKTFQNLHLHFKSCAIKHDLPPNLMLDYWDKINSDSKSNKKFPREMLDMFVAKCIKEGRLGDQVDFAKALSLSMSEGEPQTGNDVVVAATSTVPPLVEIPQQSLSDAPPNAAQVLMQAPTTSKASTAKQATKKTKSSLKTPLQLTNDETKQYNVELRIERELAASRSKHYREVVQKDNADDDDLVVIIENENAYPGKDNLFHRARMKDCDDSYLCLQADCKNHDLLLLMEDFVIYAGPSMGQAQPKESEIK